MQMSSILTALLIPRCSAGSEGIWLLQATGNEMKRGRNEEHSHRGGIQDMNCYWRGPRNSYDELEFKRRIRDEYEWTDITEGCKPRISVNGSSMTREICWLSLTGNRPNEFRSVYISFLGLPSDNYHLSVCSLHSPSQPRSESESDCVSLLLLSAPFSFRLSSSLCRAHKISDEFSVDFGLWQSASPTLLHSHSVLCFFLSFSA